MTSTPEHKLPETYSYFPVLGFRSWGVLPKNNHVGFGLWGAWGSEWETPWMEARCVDRNGMKKWDPRGPHPAPYETCNCGIHASKQPSDTYAYDAYGLVAMEDVIEGESGYRAARAWVLAWTAHPRKPPHEAEAARVKNVLSQSFPSIDVPRNFEALLRVHDYLTHNPDKIPSLKEVQDGHRQATQTNSPSNTPFPPTFRTQPESEASWRARTGYDYAFGPGAATPFPFPRP